MGFTNTITNWYSENKRDLPWRLRKNPYSVWLSEIILQQTRVQQGLNYYLKFINNYPSIFDFAKASEDQILKDWQGLGYYSRARNMHYTAKFIVNNFDGFFPNSKKELIKLKGIGDYTSSAIASICFDEVTPAIDGNVNRVISRVFGIEIPIDTNDGKKSVKSLSEEFIPKEKPGDYNQAIMDFGSIQCTPVNPRCDSCPLNNMCYAHDNNKTNSLPRKSKKIVQRIRHFNYFIFFLPNQEVVLKKRTSHDIWKNLYDFPLIETDESVTTFESLIPHSKLLRSINWPTAELKSVSKEYKHILTHQIIYAKFWEFNLKSKIVLDKGFEITNLNDLESYAFPKLIVNYIGDRYVELI